MKLDGNKTRLGLIFASVQALAGEAAKVFDGMDTTNADPAVAFTAAWVLFGAAHAIWKDYQAAKAKAAEGAK